MSGGEPGLAGPDGPAGSGSLSPDDARRLLRAMFDAAVAAADPAVTVPAVLPHPPPGRTVVVGAGKASARMAQIVAAAWPGPLSGLVAVPHGQERPGGRVEIAGAGHPVPDEASEDAARRILGIAAALGRDDLMIAVISGGGSALLALPAPGLALAGKQDVTGQLLRSGAPIDQMNVVRKHLSAIKGGRLAAAAFPAATVGLLVSDVPGDDPAVIASGPTTGEPSPPSAALAILERYRIDVPPAVLAHLRASPGCPRPGDPRLARTVNHLVAAPQASLEAAAALARRAGLTPVILGDSIEGEAREVAKVHAGVARQIRRHGQPARPPCVLLSGGETTVTVRGGGRGGRNAEFLLALAIALRGEEGIYALAADTDGADGAAEVAGAFISPRTLARARQAGLAAAGYLDGNDAHTFFGTLGDQVVTGPTGTNVNDFRAILIA